jgi:hypothetical protein
MAKHDVKIVKTGTGREETFLMAANTFVYVGDAVIKNGDYVVRIADGDPEIGTDEFMGIVTEDSTATASAAGTVKVFMPGKDTILRFKATTSTNVNTAAKINALKMHAVSLDLSGTTITIDEDETDDPNVHGFFIIGGNHKKYTLDVICNGGVGPAGGAVS